MLENVPVEAVTVSPVSELITPTTTFKLLNFPVEAVIVLAVSELSTPWSAFKVLNFPDEAVIVLAASELIDPWFVFKVLNVPRFALMKVVLTPPEAVMRPVASKVAVMMSLEATMLEVLSILILPVADAVTLVANTLRALRISLLFIWTVEMAGSYAQSAIDDRLAVVAIGTPFSNNSEPKPEPAVSSVFPSSVMLVVLMEEMNPELICA